MKNLKKSEEMKNAHVDLEKNINFVVAVFNLNFLKSF